MNRDFNIHITAAKRKVSFDEGFLGVSGENLQGNIVVDFTDTFINGVARLEVKQGDTSFFTNMTKHGNTYVLPILSSLLSVSGIIFLQICITQPGEGQSIPVFKTDLFDVPVLEAIDAQGTAPEEYPAWIDEANAKIGEIDDLVEEIQQKLDDGDFDGVGIESIVFVEKTDDGNKYAVNLTDGTVQYIVAPKGEQGGQGEQGVGISSIDFVEDTPTGKKYAITLTDGSVYYFEAEKGDTGNGIVSVTKTGTLGLVDTYTILFTDGSTTTFEVTNGDTPDVTDLKLAIQNLWIALKGFVLDIGEEFYLSLKNAIISSSITIGGNTYPTADGTSCVLSSIKGNTKQFNQLAPLITSSNYNYTNATNISVVDNTIKFTGTSSNAAIYYNSSSGFTSGKLIQGHKYYYCADIKLTSNVPANSVWLRFQWSSGGLTDAYVNPNVTTFQRVGKIVTINSAVTGVYSPFRVRDNRSSGWDEIQVKNFQLFDLTAMGLDSITTAEEFTALYPKAYYPYNAGTLYDSVISGVQLKGADQTTVTGTISLPSAQTLGGVGDMQDTVSVMKNTNNDYYTVKKSVVTNNSALTDIPQWNQLAKLISSDNYIVNNYGATVSYNNGIATITATSLNGGIRTNYRIPFTKDHKYYFACDLLSAAETVSLQVVMDETGVFNDRTIFRLQSTSTSFSKLESVRTCNSTGLSTISIRDTVSTNWQEFQARRFMIFDLTSIFGSGNEPTVSTLPEWIKERDYFDYKAPGSSLDYTQKHNYVYNTDNDVTWTGVATETVITSTATLAEVSAIRENGGMISVVGNTNEDYAQPDVGDMVVYQIPNA